MQFFKNLLYLTKECFMTDYIKLKFLGRQSLNSIRIRTGLTPWIRMQIHIEVYIWNRIRISIEKKC
jgi:hypothetical protein